jgi:hypothetical protein
VTCKVHVRSAMYLALVRLEAFGFEIVPTTADRAVRASLLKLKRKIPYVDAFGAELTAESPEHFLVAQILT